MTRQSPSLAHPPVRSRRERFLAGYSWLIFKNVIGWTLILVSFVAGPFVPGPGGIPLFLIGFALVTFPGKRRLTARVLRGRRIRLHSRPLMVVIAVLSVAVPALALWFWGTRLHIQGPLTVVGAYLLGVVLTGLLSYGAVLLLNLLLRAMPPIRRRVRPWLRNHRIHLLPPRRRRRLPHEHGTGPFRLKDEILLFLKRPRPAPSGEA